MRIAAKYELVRPLGEGGMGSVWVARNLALDTEVALKLIRAEVDFEDAGDRLLQEARAAARLGHRAICRVFDFGYTDQGDPFIVMELLHGESLASLLHARGRLSATKAVQTLLPVIEALAVAHRRGIVHRDLKPENIFIARDGDRVQPKVVDFGIAKVESALGPGRTLTRQGMVLGSPGYMSPEQAKGHDKVDYRADIWAISVVLYEAVTGQVAFQGDNYNALMRAIIEQEPPSIVSYSAGDDELARIVQRGLAKDPAERFTSMGQLGTALAAWLDSHGVTHDLTGDGLGRWLAPAEGPEGDLLSGPPVSRDSDASKRVTPAGPATLQAMPSPTAAGAPESTAALVSSAYPVRRPRRTRTGLALAALAIGIAAVIAALATREGEAGDGPAGKAAAAERGGEAQRGPVAAPAAAPASPAIESAQASSSERRNVGQAAPSASSVSLASSPPPVPESAAPAARRAPVGAPRRPTPSKAPPAAKASEPGAPPPSLKDPYR